MDLIILTDGMYHLVPVTKEMLENVRLYNSAGEMDFFDLCEILRIKLSTYYDYPMNRHVMNDGSGDFFGCIWK
tara:strand:+ start:22 stop:240 length:219 start_codon:yes stop_codon:yes gene_type:complete